MTSPAFETLLAKLYTDESFQRSFLSNPAKAAQKFGLSPEECASLARIDRVGLALAAGALKKKRSRALFQQSFRGRLMRLLRESIG
jgi:hypothetical protein